MADKRMFTRKVTDDDNFMSLSSSAQALYLHLSMSADDDGFCNQVSLSMFKAHASVQDLEALLAKRYVYQFENGVIVIKHWRMANALRKDRYTQTAFREELAKLRLKDNGVYTMSEDEGEDMVATWLPDGCQVVATEKNRVEENRVEKSRAEKSREDARTRDPFSAFAMNEDDQELTDALMTWLSEMSDTGKPLSPKDQGEILDKLRLEFPRAEWLPAIRRSAERKWRTVYPRKEDKKAAKMTEQQKAWSAPIPASDTERLIRKTQEMEAWDETD
ncbi:MAG: hypothetical protein IK082_05145 [Oscillospiraceae bacterium]|nr:hypothetical protein [Oscillospiraceae bacterium]